MTDAKLITEIKIAVDEAISKTFEQFGIGKTTKLTRIDPYKRMEQILYNYGEFQSIIEEKEKQIQEILENGLPERSKSILEYSPTGGAIEGIAIEEETVQSVVNALQEDIVWVKQVLERIDLALDAVENDTGYNILRAYYFDGYTIEECAKEYSINPRTVMSRKNKLVRRLAMTLFPKDMFYEMMEDLK